MTEMTASQAQAAVAAMSPTERSAALMCWWTVDPTGFRLALAAAAEVDLPAPLPPAEPPTRHLPLPTAPRPLLSDQSADPLPDGCVRGLLPTQDGEADG